MSAETSQLWRVVLDGGSVRGVVVKNGPSLHRGEGFYAGVAVVGGSWGVNARAAIAALASYYGWPVREILAPGELTRDEAVAAAATAEREACAEVCDLFSKARIRERGGAR